MIDYQFSSIELNILAFIAGCLCGCLFEILVFIYVNILDRRKK